jgi:hypothetical protein
VELALEDAQRGEGAWDDCPTPLWGWHAAVTDGTSVIAWGRRVPATPAFLARQVTRAWQVRWEAAPGAD